MLQPASHSSGLFSRVFGRQNAMPGNEETTSLNPDEPQESLSKFDYKGIGDTLAELRGNTSQPRRNQWNFQALNL